MREHLVAFVYIMVIAAAMFLLMAKPLTAKVMDPQDFDRRRNLWLAVTAITFLAHSFWLAALLCGIVIAFGSRRETNPAAMYCALLFAVPQFPMQIPGLGVVNQLFELDHPRLLALVLLLPAALKLMGAPRAPNPTLRVADTLFVAYFGYVFVVHATADSLTGLMRYALYVVLDQALLYYVITRSVVSLRGLTDVMASYVMGVAVICAIAVFENLRSWLVFESLRAPLGVPPPDLANYLLRSTEDGADYMRAMTTTGNSIAMGFVAMVAIVWHLYLSRLYRPTWLGVALVLALVAGILAAVSRGPWVGCAIALALGIATGPGAKRRILWALAFSPVALAALLLTTQGQRFIDLLPIVGTAEAGNVTYRTLLIDRAMIVFWQNPIFGSLQYIYNPVLEEMRQGQGIIDIVNSYIGVALPYGSIGLVLFVAPLIYALLSCWTARRSLSQADPSGEAAGRALAASLIGIMLVIGSTSHFLHVPIIHWMLVALCVAYAAMAPARLQALAAGAANAARTRGATAAAPQPAGPASRPQRRFGGLANTASARPENTP